MNDELKTSGKENRFTQIFEDAKRTLKRRGRYRFIDRIPPMDEKDKPKMPFPWGAPPGYKKDWKWIPGISDSGRRSSKHTEKFIKELIDEITEKEKYKG